MNFLRMMPRSLWLLTGPTTDGIRAAVIICPIELKSITLPCPPYAFGHCWLRPRVSVLGAGSQFTTEGNINVQHAKQVLRARSRPVRARGIFAHGGITPASRALSAHKRNRSDPTGPLPHDRANAGLLRSRWPLSGLPRHERKWRSARARSHTPRPRVRKLPCAAVPRVPYMFGYG